MLVTFGDGTTCVCSFDGCDVVLTYETLTVDRWPIPGCKGGRYIRTNVRPACGFCNSSDGGNLSNMIKKEEMAAVE